MTPAKSIAIEKRLRNCKNVLTLGVKPNFSDYTPGERDMILKADKIYYPTPFYADLFDTVGKRTFPSRHTYHYAQDKVKQTALFNLLGVPHPRTEFYFGRNKAEKIIESFTFPFIGKIPRGSAMGKGVFLINDEEALHRYCGATHVAYIQKYMPVDRDLRIVVIGYEAVVAYWRVAPPLEFRTNVSTGGRVVFDAVPDLAVALAVRTARACQWDDVGIDIICHNDGMVVLEGNMKYGKAGFKAAGIDYDKMMEEKIEHGKI